jgi:hypothetical protein
LAKRIERKQLLNDQAYFVLCLGQLESEIDEACRDAIRNRQSDKTWANRRGFDFYNPDMPKSMQDIYTIWHCSCSEIHLKEGSAMDELDHPFDPAGEDLGP